MLGHEQSIHRNNARVGYSAATLSNRPHPSACRLEIVARGLHKRWSATVEAREGHLTLPLEVFTQAQLGTSLTARVSCHDVAAKSHLRYFQYILRVTVGGLVPLFGEALFEAASFAHLVRWYLPARLLFP
jgi:hypothetical protein